MICAFAMIFKTSGLKEGSRDQSGHDSRRDSPKYSFPFIGIVALLSLRTLRNVDVDVPPLVCELVEKIVVSMTEPKKANVN
mmetsp:Transcript_1088/g.1529  ORF Transcript_1088/g.1529 Transcript_1088/m.1529 type:complete len:81 (-) Transcript_1088:67-309(-)